MVGPDDRCPSCHASWHEGENRTIWFDFVAHGTHYRAEAYPTTYNDEEGNLISSAWAWWVLDMNDATHPSGRVVDYGGVPDMTQGEAMNRAERLADEMKRGMFTMGHGEPRSRLQYPGGMGIA